MESKEGVNKPKGCKRYGSKSREIIIDRDKTGRRRKETLVFLIPVACKESCL